MNNKQPCTQYCTYEISFSKYADSITSKNNLKYLLHHIKQFNVDTEQDLHTKILYRAIYPTC